MIIIANTTIIIQPYINQKIKTNKGTNEGTGKGENGNHKLLKTNKGGEENDK